MFVTAKVWTQSILHRGDVQTLYDLTTLRKRKLTSQKGRGADSLLSSDFCRSEVIEPFPDWNDGGSH